MVRVGGVDAGDVVEQLVERLVLDGRAGGCRCRAERIKFDGRGTPDRATEDDLASNDPVFEDDIQVAANARMSAAASLRSFPIEASGSLPGTAGIGPEATVSCRTRMYLTWRTRSQRCVWGDLLANAELGGTVQLWEWSGDEGATTFSYWRRDSGTRASPGVAQRCGALAERQWSTPEQRT